MYLCPSECELLRDSSGSHQRATTRVMTATCNSSLHSATIQARQAPPGQQRTKLFGSPTRRCYTIVYLYLCLPSLLFKLPTCPQAMHPLTLVLDLSTRRLLSRCSIISQHVSGRNSYGNASSAIFYHHYIRNT